MNEQATEASGPIEASVADVFGPATETEQTTPEVQETPPSQPQQPAAESPEPKFPTPEQITASVREGLRQSQPQEPQRREYTPDELDQLFNVWKPTPELLQQVLAGGEEGLTALLAVRDGLAKQFGTLLQYQLELARRDLVSQMDPALRFVAEAAAEKDRNAFFEQNPDLKEHEKLTQTVFNALKAEGYQAPDVATAYKTLADRTRALLPTGGSNGSASAPSSGGRTKTSPTERRPASLSSGSQAGGGGGSAPQVPFPGAEVFL